MFHTGTAQCGTVRRRSQQESGDTWRRTVLYSAGSGDKKPSHTHTLRYYRSMWTTKAVCERYTIEHILQCTPINSIVSDKLPVDYGSRVPGLYLEFSVRGCNGRAEGSGGRKSPSGVQGKGCGGGLGAKPPEVIGTMKYCAYKNWFLCIICLYVIAKTCTEIEKT